MPEALLLMAGKLIPTSGSELACIKLYILKGAPIMLKSHLNKKTIFFVKKYWFIKLPHNLDSYINFRLSL